MAARTSTSDQKQGKRQKAASAFRDGIMTSDVGDVLPGVDDADDSWLYGDGAEGGTGTTDPHHNLRTNNGEDADKDKDERTTRPVDGSSDPQGGEDGDGDGDGEVNNDDAHFNDEHFEDGEQPGEEMDGEAHENGDSDSDDSEDDVKVILGDIKSAPPTSYPSLNIKRGGLIVQTGIEKQKHTGKFSVDDFEAVGTINGVPAQEFNIDVLEDKPWRKPGADLTDYFNYGFNEDTWRAYCERQKRMRIHESGAGLIPLGGNSITGIQQPRHPTPILNDNSKYSVGFANARKAGPPPGRKLTGPIDVIGGRRDGVGPAEDSPEQQIKQPMQIPVRENTIQVMTADRREYSRNKPFPDMSLPPPGPMAPPPGDFFHAPPDQQFYPTPYHPEEPWGNKSGWAPSDIKELTPGPMGGPMGPPPHMGMPPHMGPGMGPPPGMPPHPSVIGGPPSVPPPPYGNPHMHMHHREMDMRDPDDGRDKDDHESSEMRDRNRDRDRDRDRSRSSKPDRQREKSHRRERSRSRSRRHKSRSRSPSSRHRSKKKSSHRKDKEDSD